ncbi:MAG: hypothetical protein ACRDT4_21100, partial [Micromonosporaceae bacterium]
VDPVPPLRGGIGDRASRLQQSLATGAGAGVGGAVGDGGGVPGRFSVEGEDPVMRTRIWDTDPRAGGPATPSPY